MKTLFYPNSLDSRVNTSRNSSSCMISGGRKSIKDLIKKFEKNDEKCDIKRHQHVDLISHLNNNFNQDNYSNDRMRPKSTVYDYNKHSHDSTFDYNKTRPKSVYSTYCIERNDNSDEEYTETFYTYCVVTKPLENMKKVDENSELITNTDSIWNGGRRKSSIQLIKPSMLNKNKLISDYSNHSEIADEKNTLQQISNTMILPRRVSGPIYESRRSSFSNIKPSEIWDSDELPNVMRRNSKIIDEKLLITQRKSIKETNESVLLSDEQVKRQSAWVTKPGNSQFLVKPSQVKITEISKQNDFKNKRSKILLEWCQEQIAGSQKYNNVNIINFSSSWANGLAFCALIHKFVPHAFNYESLDPNNREQNFKIAFDAGEKYADIPQLLEVEDMIKMGNKPDSRCVYTYVATMYTYLTNFAKKNKL